MWQGCSDSHAKVCRNICEYRNHLMIQNDTSTVFIGVKLLTQLEDNIYNDLQLVSVT